MPNIYNYTRQLIIEMRLRNYSPRTIKAYHHCVKSFLSFKEHRLAEIDHDCIKKFLLEKRDVGLAPQSTNLYLNAIKFFYQEIVKSPLKIDLKFSKKLKKLPVVLSRADIEDVLENVHNHKHYLLIALSYGAGLRVSEAINLRVGDLDFDKNLIHLKVTKGSKERYSILPKRLYSYLNSFVSRKSANDFVFESERGGKLSVRTAQKVFFRLFVDLQ